MAQQPSPQPIAHHFFIDATASLQLSTGTDEVFGDDAVVFVDEHEIAFGGTNSRLCLRNDGRHHLIQIKFSIDGTADVIE